MTTSEWPAASSWRKARSSLAMSSKCRPVVGSSKRNSLGQTPVFPAWAADLAVRQVAGELEALRLAAGERGHGLAEAQVVEAHVREGLQAREHLGVAREELDCLGDGHVEHVGDRSCRAAALPAPRAVALAVAVRAAQVHVGEELHLDVLEAVAAAGRAAAVARVEAEGAGRVLARLRLGRAREQVADGVERADIARRVGARGLADRRLVHHHHLADGVPAAQAAVPAGRFGGLALGLEQRRVEHVLHQRGLARAGDARDADQTLERDRDVEVLQVVLRRAQQLEEALRLPGRARRLGALAAGEVLGGQRARRFQFRRRAEEHHLAAALAWPGSHVEDAVGGEHDLRIVLHHHERVAGVAQLAHHLDHTPHVARVQPDGGLVQHEQRVDERRAERRGEVDALHLAARERARLAVERQVAEADVAEVGKARADLLEQQLGCLVHRRGQLQGLEEPLHVRHGQEHQVVDRPALDLPQQRVGLEARPAAGRALRVGAVLGQQHPDVHLVGLALQPLEEAPHAVPLAGQDFLQLTQSASPSSTQARCSAGISRHGTSIGTPCFFAYLARSSWHSLKLGVCQGLIAPSRSVFDSSGITSP